jgi:anti-sigma regulatory factor (Ser/Thr protein kinase)
VRGDVVNAPVVQKRTFGVSVGDVTAIDSWVEDVTARLGVSEQMAFRTRVCIAELAANVLEHGMCPAENDHIVISIHGLEDGINVEFLDTRGAFDPTAKSAAPRTIDSSSTGGRGLLVLHAYTDNMKYANDGTYNCVKFKVKLSG